VQEDFEGAVKALMSNDPGQAAALAEEGLTDAVIKSVADETGLLPGPIKAVLRAVLTGHVDELDVLALQAAALDAAAEGGATALWETARRSKTIKVQAIERRAGTYGFKADDVKAVFVAVVDDPQIQAAVAALIQGNPEPAKTLAHDASLDQVTSPTALPHLLAHVSQPWRTTRPSTRW